MQKNKKEELEQIIKNWGNRAKILTIFNEFKFIYLDNKTSAVVVINPDIKRVKSKIAFFGFFNKQFSVLSPADVMDRTTSFGFISNAEFIVLKSSQQVLYAIFLKKIRFSKSIELLPP